MTDREQLLEELRPVAFAIAYRMLGGVSEAEDVVQEALLRTHAALEGDERIASPRAFVATVTTRLAIDELRSARARRERYVGQWLPEPIITDGSNDPAQHAEMADSLSIAMLVLLESLSPEQRAVLLLHDVFDYGYPEIASIVGKSEDNVRQLASRARRHVEQRRPRFQTSREQHEELAARFFAAAQQGDLAGRYSLTMSSSPATAAARSPPWRGRCAAETASPVRCSAGSGLAPGFPAPRCDPSRSTAAPAHCCSMHRSGSSECGRWRLPRARSAALGRSSTPTSSRTSDPSPTSRLYCAQPPQSNEDRSSSSACVPASASSWRSHGCGPRL